MSQGLQRYSKAERKIIRQKKVEEKRHRRQERRQAKREAAQQRTDKA